LHARKDFAVSPPHQFNNWWGIRHCSHLNPCGWRALPATFNSDPRSKLRVRTFLPDRSRSSYL